MDNVNESYAHKLSKQLLYEWLLNEKVLLRDQNNKEYYFNDLHGEIEYEFVDNDKKYFFDIYFYDDENNKIAVEILHTHLLEENKKKTCKNHGITLLEVKSKAILNRTVKPHYIKVKSYYTNNYSDHYRKLNLTKNEAFKNKIGIIEFNLERLKTKYIEVNYNKLYQKMKYCLKQLIFLQEIAVNSFTKNGAFQNRDIIFFVSGGYLAKLLGINEGQNRSWMIKKMSLLCFLGLIEKVPLEHIPAHLYKNSEMHKKINRKHKIINYYKIIKLDDKVLKKAEDRVEMLTKYGLGFRNFGRRHLEKYFGKEEADRVYPMFNGEQLQSVPEQVYSFIENELVNSLQRNAYIVEKDFLKNLYNKIYKLYKIKNQLEINAYIGEMLVKYDLKRERLNKKLKETHGVNVNGYPFIIIKN